MKQVICTAAICLMASNAYAHDYLRDLLAPAGYVQEIVMRVPHGCKDSPVNKVRIKIPESVFRVTAIYRDDWDIELVMREINPPAVGFGGQPITETVDQIIWSNPKTVLPPDRVGEFAFRAQLPNEPGTILYFKTLNDCVEGTDYYVDLPEEPLELTDPKFHEKFWAFMTATATPAPYLILVKPERPQYPWDWKTAEDKPLPDNN